MIQYKVVVTRVREAEEVMNRLTQDGWLVVDTAMSTMNALTVGGQHMVITFGRQE